MSQTQNHLIDRRVMLLANVFLSRRPDILFLPMAPDDAINQIVRIGSDDDPFEKLFGVIQVGTPDPLPDEEAATQYLNEWGEDRTDFKRFPFPILVLLFSMYDDVGYFAWQAEPETTEDHAPRLKIHETFDCERINKKTTLNKIVKKIEKWHAYLFDILLNHQ